MAHAVKPDPKINRLLAALPDAQRAAWLPQLESIQMLLGKVLYESGAKTMHVYFPITSIVSLFQVMENGASTSRAGLIDYRRGHITVLDRAALERRSCESYAVVKREYDRLLPATIPI
jgi:hypothetical protein